MLRKSDTIPPGDEALDLFAAGHLGELTQIVDCDLVDAVLEETGTRERRLRLLPARVMVYFTLALAVFEHCSYQAVWGKLTAGLDAWAPTRPASSSLSRARRRLGAAPLHRLFATLAGPVATPGQGCAFYQGLRLVAVDGTTLCAPDEKAVTWKYRKHIGEVKEFGYPLVRLVALVECGTRALLDAVFGPDRIGELAYAQRLLGRLDPALLLLADAYYDAVGFLTAVSDTGAPFLLRSTRKRRPTTRHPLSDGSYRTFILSNNYRAGQGYGKRLEVRVIEAWVTVALADGTRRTELWRLLTTLMDAERYPASELIDLYHRRWQVETCYFSLKSTILNGRILRSRTVPGVEQEIYALLTVYQALIRTAGDLTTAHPEVSPQRVSFTVLLQAAADQIVTAGGIAPTGPVPLVGAIGRAALARLIPQERRWRLKARMRKRHSKYPFTRNRHPRATQRYTLHTQVIKDGVLDNAIAP